MILNNWMKTM